MPPISDRKIGITAIITANLDKTYELRCTCGYYRDYGYMWQTAENEYTRHRERFPDHSVDLIVNDAVPLKQMEIQRKIYMGKTRPTKTLRVEPGMT